MSIDELEIQCWICPICFDDHRVNEDRAFCKTKDLETLRAENEKLKESLDRVLKEVALSTDRDFSEHCHAKVKDILK